MGKLQLKKYYKGGSKGAGRGKKGISFTLYPLLKNFSELPASVEHKRLSAQRAKMALFYGRIVGQKLW